jgi:hypothetical protein
MDLKISTNKAYLCQYKKKKKIPSIISNDKLSAFEFAVKDLIQWHR